MKKFVTLLTMLLCSVAQANYTTENKIIKVVIPQAPSAGISATYLHIEAYAKKHNITMVPVFKPGADGKIGINYASKEKNDGNTLLLSTISDYANTDAEFDKVAPLVKLSFVLVASKKSKITSVNDIVKQEKENPGKLIWAHAASAQETLINHFTKSTNIDKPYKVPFSFTGISTGIVSGDIDLAYITATMAKSLTANDRLTIVDIDEKTKQRMSTKENATALFLPANSPNDANKFWNKFVKDMIVDADFKEAMKSANTNTFADPSPEELIKIINNWKL